MTTVIEEMTKDELLLEFRAVRNTLKTVEQRKMAIVRTAIANFGTDEQKRFAVLNSDATIFEMLLS